MARYCAAHPDHIDRVYATLAYVDRVNFTARAVAPAIFSVGLMDRICLPSTVFAAYKHDGDPKELGGVAVFRPRWWRRIPPPGTPALPATGLGLNPGSIDRAGGSRETMGAAPTDSRADRQAGDDPRSRMTAPAPRAPHRLGSRSQPELTPRPRLCDNLRYLR